MESETCGMQSKPVSACEDPRIQELPKPKVEMFEKKDPSWLGFYPTQKE